MTINITAIIIVIWLHFIGDFILQTNKMALNKSSLNTTLMFHCFIYSLPLLWFGIEFAIVNMVFHFIIDVVTSRINSKLYKFKDLHWFFVGIGIDQAIHLTVLISMLRIENKI